MSLQGPLGAPGQVLGFPWSDWDLSREVSRDWKPGAWADALGLDAVRPSGEGPILLPASARGARGPAPAHTAVSRSLRTFSFFLFILQKPWKPQKQAKVNWGMP